MWMVIGAVAGVLLGLALDDDFAAVLLGLFAGFIGWMKDRADRRGAAAPTTRSDATELAIVLARLDALEGRLARVEHQLNGAAGPMAAPLAEAGPTPVVPVPTPMPAAQAEVTGERKDTSVPPPRPAYGAAVVSAPDRETVAARAPSSRAAAQSAFAAARDWLVGGNTLTRIGIVILFFGVAFLLRYFAEVVAVPIEAKLAGAGLAGLALATLGVRLTRSRPGYGLSLQGAGMGVVYLTVFAAFRLYAALPPLPSIVLLVAVSAATVALAWRHDSQALAGLALAGGFVAPILIETGATAPALLFGWFAILNAAVLAIAWRRAWRVLNVLGFVFTFALSLAWGWSFYRPAHFPTVQPFLLLFFLFYVGIAILYAKRSPLEATAPVDGVLVFGVPLVGFALQSGLVRDFPYGAAWSAVALAVFYGALWGGLRRRQEPGLARLAKAFAALAVVFATLAIPFALDARWTSAGWAIEAAAVYWLGIVQRQRAARWFALVVEIAAAGAFAWSWPAPGGVAFANAAFVGMGLIGLAALAIVFVADRHPEATGPGERRLLPWLLAWGGGWWLAAGVREAGHVYTGAAQAQAALAWVSGSAALALAFSRVLRWPRLAWLFVVVLPALVLAGTWLLDLERTTLVAGGAFIWPIAWLVHAAGLRVADAMPAQPSPGVSARQRDLHAVTASAFVAWLAWEASEWTGRVTADGSVWMACAAALPAIAYLVLVTRGRAATTWPMDRHADAYGHRAGLFVASALSAWFAIVSVVSPGDPRPWPFVPVANPLDITLIVALVALLSWAGAWARLSLARRVAAGALAGFVALNGAIVRTAYHWGSVAWDASALFAYRPLQATLTLAWTLCALALMVVATRRGVREVWLAGGTLLAVVVAKLFLVDLEALSGLTRVVAFLGVGVLLLVIGYLTPLPPARGDVRGP